MSIHGSYVSNDSKTIRVSRDEYGSMIRIFLLEEWYDRLKPLYDYADKIVAGISVERIPNQVSDCFDWLSSFFIEFGAFGWVFTFSILAWIFELAKNQISLGKFTYDAVGRLGSARLGSVPLGGGTRVFELPVEG
ncbi:hypothetical protein [Natrinema versiforme]|uniref:Uncharacterized protein n=1 Tax=Natrinema versiforme TaxID=88724 RepID=A0A4P8WKP6_9EURY|nr:hypothetical protein [Natrinema versiforme]QCS43865.1 hypothetical protein FEJ81_16490 [Natrinema versiforme]